MASEYLVFYAFAAIAVLGSLFVIVQRNPIYSVLSLIGAFFGLSGLYVLLDAPFVAVAQIVIYAGAILVTYVFVIMLATQSVASGHNAQQNGQPAALAEYDLVSREPVVACAVGFTMMAVLLIVRQARRQ